MTPAPLPITTPPPRAPRTPGTCRVCGCTDAEGCILQIHTGPTITGGAPVISATTCSWVEDDLCSRCHGPRRPTRRQTFEIARIQAVQGRLEIRPSSRTGHIDVHLLQPGPGAALEQPTTWKRARTLTLDPAGRPIR